MNIALTFHRITKNDFTNYEDVSIEKLLFLLDKISGSTCSLNDIVESKVTDPSWLLTFDDGFSSDVEIALPLLKSFNVSAIFFIVTSYIGKPNYLSKNQIIDLANCGMSIGSHSVNHYDMLNLSKIDRMNELIVSKKELEKIISKKVSSFSFPYGRYNNKIVKDVYDAGYEYCFTSKPGVFKAKDKLIPRLSLNAQMSEKEIAELVEKKIVNKLKDSIYYKIKDFAKFCIGMNNYWRLRKLFLNEKN